MNMNEGTQTTTTTVPTVFIIMSGAYVRGAMMDRGEAIDKVAELNAAAGWNMHNIHEVTAGDFLSFDDDGNTDPTQNPFRYNVTYRNWDEYNAELQQAQQWDDRFLKN